MKIKFYEKPVLFLKYLFPPKNIFYEISKQKYLLIYFILTTNLFPACC